MIFSGIFINAELDFFFTGNLNIFFDGIKMPQCRHFGANKAAEMKRSPQFMMKEIMLLRLEQSREGPLAICAWSTTKTTFNDKASPENWEWSDNDSLINVAFVFWRTPPSLINVDGNKVAAADHLFKFSVAFLYGWPRNEILWNSLREDN